MISNLIRVGVVTDVDPINCAVRVVIRDKDDLVTDWLPVVFAQTVGNRDFSLPSINEDAVCLFLGSGVEAGFCIGSIYNSAPPTTSLNKRGVWFEDGSHVEFDKEAGSLTVNAKGAVLVTAAGGVTINGNLNVSGSINATTVSADSITRGGVPL